MRPGSALVLFSGGQDSTTCLAWALTHFAHVETVGFDYGQRHAVEMDARLKVRAGMVTALPQYAGRLGPEHRGAARCEQGAIGKRLLALFSGARFEVGHPSGRNVIALPCQGTRSGAQQQPFGRQLRARPRPRKQPRPDRLFQHLNPGRHGGLCDLQPFGGAAFAGHHA